MCGVHIARDRGRGGGGVSDPCECRGSCRKPELTVVNATWQESTVHLPFPGCFDDQVIRVELVVVPPLALNYIGKHGIWGEGSFFIVLR